MKLINTEDLLLFLYTRIADAESNGMFHKVKKGADTMGIEV